MTFQTFTPLQYLQIDIASNYGLDKETWNTRLEWFRENEHQLADLAVEAENPALYAAGLMAYDLAKAGKPVHYMISLDATASGAQIMAATVGCRKSAELCNVVDTGNREDFYTRIHEGVLARCPDANDITRAQSKQAGMTHLYNSKAEPRKAYGADSPALQAFYQTFAEDAPGVEQLNQAIYRMRNPEATEYNWVLPDNFHAGYKVEDILYYNVEFMGQQKTIAVKSQQPNDQDRALGANVIHSIDGMIVREIIRRCDYDVEVYTELAEMLMQETWLPASSHTKFTKDDEMVQTLWSHYQQTGFLSARIIDHLTMYNVYMVDYSVILKLLKSMPKKPFKVLAVHDCFRVHPNYGNDIREQYNNLLSLLANSTILDSVLSQATQKSWYVPKFDHIVTDIKDANYALS